MHDLHINNSEDKHNADSVLRTSQPIITKTY